VRVFSRQGLVRDPEKFKLDPHGPWHQEVHEFGLNYRLPDILCALGISQISKINKFKLARSDVFNAYSLELAGLENIKLPTLREYVDPMWHLYPIRVPAQHRKYIFEGLRAKEIGVQINYIPANMHPVFDIEINNLENLENSRNFYAEEISLPMMANYKILDKTSISYVCKSITDLLKEI
jgi:dTDP-4-amino-4,6-dideoxygalactose transaminase